MGTGSMCTTRPAHKATVCRPRLCSAGSKFQQPVIDMPGCKWEEPCCISVALVADLPARAVSITPDLRHPTRCALLSLPCHASMLTWPRALWTPVERWGGMKRRDLTTWDWPPRLSLSRASTVCCCPCCSASSIWRSASCSSVPRREMLILHDQNRSSGRLSVRVERKAFDKALDIPSVTVSRSRQLDILSALSPARGEACQRSGICVRVALSSRLTLHKVKGGGGVDPCVCVLSMGGWGDVKEKTAEAAGDA